MNDVRQIIAHRTLLLLFSAALIACLFQQAAFAQTLRPSSNGRYIEWSNGTPVFLLSDTAWLLPGRYSTAEVASHVSSRASQGFTAIQMTVCFPEVQNGAALQNITSIFTSGDLARPITSYFDAVDAKIRQVTDGGLIAIVNPFWKKGSDPIISSAGTTKCRNYAKWLATRHRTNPRVAWFIGGDDRPEPVRAEMEAMGLGIQDAYAEAGLPAPIIAYHGDPAQSSREAFPANPSWLTLDWTYAYSLPLGDVTPYQENWVSWPKTPTKPIMQGEGWYDRDNGASTSSRWGNRQMLRRQSWWSVLSGGIAGYAYGAEPIWLHRHGSNTPAIAVTWNSGGDAARVKTFLYTTEWWRLRPDLNSTFLTGSNGAVGSNERAVAALADDNSFAVAYTPNARDLTLRMPSSGRTYSLRWYDPTNATYRPGSVAGASGASVTMTHPGNNASGAADWVVHVSSGGTPLPPPAGTVQAENAVLAGGVLVESNQAGFNGTGFLNFPPTGGSAQFNGIDGGSSGGSASLTIRFANGASSGARTGRLLINGQPQAITFGPTGSWTTWSNLAVNVLLVRGAGNIIRLESNGQDLGNIDRITVTLSDVPPPPPGTIADGTYRAINRNSLKALDALGGRTADGTAILQYTYSGSNNQRWMVQDRGNSQFSIIGVSSGKALNVIGAGTGNGTKLELRTYTGADNQKWTFTPVGLNYRVTPVHATGSALEIEGASTANSGLAQIWAYSSGNHQLWSFTAP